MGVAAAIPAAALALAASLLYLADQATDVLTALLYIQDVRTPFWASNGSNPFKGLTKYISDLVF